MKKLLIGLAIILAISIAGCGKNIKPAFAQDLNINLKQGFLYTLQEKQVKNLTTFEILRTKPIENFGKWNIILDGWSLDVGGAYNSEEFNGALLIGRDFGTIGKYIPIEFPLKDKISITLYPIGIYIKDLFDHPELQLASGAGIVKLTIKF